MRPAVLWSGAALAVLFFASGFLLQQKAACTDCPVDTMWAKLRIQFWAGSMLKVGAAAIGLIVVVHWLTKAWWVSFLSALLLLGYGWFLMVGPGGEICSNCTSAYGTIRRGLQLGGFIFFGGGLGLAAHTLTLAPQPRTVNPPGPPESPSSSSPPPSPATWAATLRRSAKITAAVFLVISVILYLVWQTGQCGDCRVRPHVTAAGFAALAFFLGGIVLAAYLGDERLSPESEAPPSGKS